MEEMKMFVIGLPLKTVTEADGFTVLSTLKQKVINLTLYELF